MAKVISLPSIEVKEITEYSNPNLHALQIYEISKKYQPLFTALIRIGDYFLGSSSLEPLLSSLSRTCVKKRGMELKLRVFFHLFVVIKLHATSN
jgi:hypothetical protein